MKTPQCNLASDNHAPTHPRILAALDQVNQGLAPAYGSDPWTLRAEQILLDAFHRKGRAFMVPTGTGSNVLALKICCKGYESILCTPIAHINCQETGSAEALVGCKLLGVPHTDDKLTVEKMEAKLYHERASGKHSTIPKVVSITQPTEAGTVYTLEELEKLSSFCKKEGLYLHMDGSRLYNALITLNCSFADIGQHVDILSLGGTKNGLMGAEALLIFHEELLQGADYYQKQMLQLMSKTRYLSAQFLPFFEEEIWRECALQANEKAQEIGALLQNTKGIKIDYPIETNQIFFSVNPALIPLIQERVLCYLWDQSKHQLRLVTSWVTSSDDVNAISSLCKEMTARG